MSAQAPIFDRQYALLFDQLGQQLKAGLPVREALAHALEGLQGPMAGAVRGAVADVRDRVERGDGVAESMGRHPAVFPPHVARFLAAAEAAGRLPEALLQLGDLHQARHARALRLGGKLAYPAFLLVATAFIGPAGLIVAGQPGAYAARALGQVVPLAALAAGTVWLAWSPAAAGARARLYAAAVRVPGLGAALRKLAVARLGQLLALCFGAGLAADAVFALAADATPDPALRRACLAVAAETRRGRAIAAAMEAQKGAFPRTLTTVVRTGEESGRLDEALARAADLWGREADAATDALVGLATMLCFGAALLTVAYTIVSIGMGVLGGVREVVGD